MTGKSVRKKRSEEKLEKIGISEDLLNVIVGLSPGAQTVLGYPQVYRELTLLENR